MRRGLGWSWRPPSAVLDAIRRGEQKFRRWRFEQELAYERGQGFDLRRTVPPQFRGKR